MVDSHATANEPGPRQAAVIHGCATVIPQAQERPSALTDVTLTLEGVRLCKNKHSARTDLEESRNLCYSAEPHFVLQSPLLVGVLHPHLRRTLAPSPLVQSSAVQPATDTTEEQSLLVGVRPSRTRDNVRTSLPPPEPF